MRREAALKIDVVIVGGSIGGLACAYALGKSGHRVHVLERAKGPNQGGGGIRIPPNLTKILMEWGLEKELSKFGRCQTSTFISLETGEPLGCLKWQDDVMKEAGGEFLLMHYDDLYQLLYNLALSADAKISFGKTVTSVFVDEEETPTVALADGTELKADMVVGADGARSLVRAVVTGLEDDGVDTGSSFYTTIIPPVDPKEDPELAGWMENLVMPIEMGDGRSIWGYPVTRAHSPGVEYSVTVFWPDDELKEPSAVPEGWDIQMTTDNINLDKYDGRVRRAFHAAREARRVKYVLREVVDDWVDETGKIVLIGDAAHPVMPCCIQAPGLAVEDAAVLGELFARLHSSEQVPQLLEAFHDLRQERCSFVRTSELANAALVTMPPGEGREMRDAGMRMSLQDDSQNWDDEMLLDQWEQISQVFGYNAREAAEDWWLKWGVLSDSSRGANTHAPMQMMFQVSEVTSAVHSD